MLKSFIAACILLVLLTSCGGSETEKTTPVPPTPNETIRGVTLFYLFNKYQGVPYILQNIDTPEVRADLDEIVGHLKDANVNTIRILIGAYHFPNNNGVFLAWPVPWDGTYVGWPKPETWQTEGLRKYVNYLYSHGFKVSLVFVGMSDYPKGAMFTSAHTDMQWIKAYLAALDKSKIFKVLLTADAFTCSINGCEDSEMTRNHANYIRELWALAPRDWPVSYAVIGSAEHSPAPMLRNQIAWFKKNTPDAPVSLALYGKPTLEGLRIVADAGVPIYVDEYGFMVNELQQYRDFLQLALCEKRWPVFAWVAGSGHGGFELFADRKPTEAFKVIAEYYKRCM